MVGYADQAKLARSRAFIVGVNMPWGAWCGHDFGLHPNGWGHARQDFRKVEQELHALRSLGVTVVRWFILASGVNYPCRTAAATAPQRADGTYPQAIDQLAERTPRDGTLARATSWLRRRSARVRPPDGRFEWRWKAAPSVLSAEFLADFIALCRACQAAKVQLLPSLLSFEWFQAPVHKGDGVYGGGRAQLILGPPREGDVRAHVQAFLDATLSPLLTETTRAFGKPSAAADDQHPIFAWESINEPDWVTRGGPRLIGHLRQPVTARDMNTFLGAFRENVLAAGYDHSIGFKQFDPVWLSRALRSALVADGARYVHQGHHYPTLSPRGRFEHTLATNRFLPPRDLTFSRCLVGEFASAQGQKDFRRPGNWPWRDPELLSTEQSRGEYLERRLALIASRGYDGALLWAAKDPGTDARTAWTSNTKRQLAAFLRSRTNG